MTYAAAIEQLSLPALCLVPKFRRDNSKALRLLTRQRKGFGTVPPVFATAAWSSNPKTL
jgi:hypothetical protein